MSAPNLHWKRGLFRLWLVLSGLWLVGAGWALLPDLYRAWPDVLDVKTISTSMNEARASITSLSPFGWIDTRTQGSGFKPNAEASSSENSSISFGVDPADDTAILNLENSLDNADKAKDTTTAKSIAYQITELRQIGHPEHWQISVNLQNGKHWDFAGVPYDTSPEQIKTILSRFFRPQWVSAAFPKLLFLVLPPLLLLLAALLLHWIIAGFRTSRQIPD